MFHVFFVSRGYMLVLDPPVGVDLAMGSIYELQRCIQDATGVDVQEQVWPLCWPTFRNHDIHIRVLDRCSFCRVASRLLTPRCSALMLALEQTRTRCIWCGEYLVLSARAKSARLRGTESTTSTKVGLSKLISLPAMPSLKDNSDWRSGVEKAEKMAPSTAEYVKLGKLGVQCSETMFKFCAKGGTIAFRFA